jgi:sialate O-acetylesterase
MRRRYLAGIVLVTLASVRASVLADIRLGSLFGDHMVIQRGIEAPVFGKTTSDARVSVAIDGKEVARTEADTDGTFEVKLPVLDAPGPYTITITSGDDTVTLNDVLAGDVWVCSGQSNMQWTVAASTNPAQEIAAANYPNIRLVHVPRVPKPEPIEHVKLNWTPTTPETVNAFSAVGYFFGRHLHQELGVPIGLINTSWGGTRAESWTPLARLESMRTLSGVNRLLEIREAAQKPGAEEEHRAKLLAWHKATGRDNSPPTAESLALASPEFDDADWQTLDATSDWARAGVKGGIVWARKVIDVPAELAGQELTLNLGLIDDMDRTYFNGEEVGKTGLDAPQPAMTQRQYKVPASQVKAGRNVVAVRIFDIGGGFGLKGPADQMVASVGDTRWPLANEWKVKHEQPLRALTAQDPKHPGAMFGPENPHTPGNLFNGMVAPLGQFGIKGAIWYQGESNAPDFAEYEQVMTTMIESWRDQFKVDAFPFYLVGLANFQPATDDPNKPSNWAGLREAQRQIARNVENAGMSVTIDIGNPADIHPQNKQDVGKRLALIALKDTYGKDLVSRGPTFDRAEFGQGKVTLHFANVGGGLKAAGETLESFSVAGADGVFVWADAKIEGDTVVVSSATVPAPVKVRYAWADNPKASLFNAEGLPAEPFEATRSPEEP